ncbi:MAG: glycosyltransferase family 2 protein [Candidatus Falkowbacteria bacterium]
MQKIAVFIPVYNEAETLARVLAGVIERISGLNADIIVVDDKSTDKSVEIARQFTPHVVLMESNGGVGAATRKGFEYIASRGGYDHVVKLDGDGQHNLGFFGEIIDGLHAGYDVVICSRFHPLSDQSDTPIDRILLNMIFTEILRKITSWRLTDVRSGCMGLRYEYVEKMAGNMVVSGYGIPMEILLRVWDAKPDARILEIPHPALYGGNISRKLKNKYSTEKLSEKSDRLQIAYAALLSVLESLRVPKEVILKANGFMNYRAKEASSAQVKRFSPKIVPIARTASNSAIAL